MPKVDSMKKTPASQAQPPTLGRIAPYLKRHDKYYFPDGDVLLMVEDTLYNVYRKPLARNSTLLRARLAESAPQGETRTVNRNSGAVPSSQTTTLFIGLDAPVYYLHGVTVPEFDTMFSLLWVESDKWAYDWSQFTQQQWYSALRLSTLWGSALVRDITILRLDHDLRDQPIERLYIANTYGVLKWRDRALLALVERKEPLGEDEAARLALSDVVHVAREREKRAAQPPWPITVLDSIVTTVCSYVPSRDQLSNLLSLPTILVTSARDYIGSAIQFFKDLALLVLNLIIAATILFSLVRALFWFAWILLNYILPGFLTLILLSFVLSV